MKDYRIVKKSASLRLDWHEFVSAYGLFTKKRLISLFLTFERVKKSIATLLYRQRGRFAQPFAHFWLGLFLFLGIAFSSVIEETIRGQQMGWESTPAGNQVIASQGSFYDVSTLTAGGMRGEAVDYVVRSGDTLSSIAKKFGLSIDTLIWANNLSAKATIKTGQKIKIPPVDGVIHQVRRGETVYSIAKKYQTNPQGIVDFPFNTFANDETFALEINQTLMVPDGIMPKKKPIAPKAPFVADVSQGVGKAGFIWPTTGKISQRYSWYHPAVDIANKNAPAITAAAAGKVISVIRGRWGYGNYLVIDHGEGYKTLYAHLSSISVSAGQNVSQGQGIGKMGSTGRSIGIHLHFEIIKNGAKLNPLTLLK